MWNVELKIFCGSSNKGRLEISRVENEFFYKNPENLWLPETKQKKYWKKKLEEVAQSESTDTVIDPPSPIRQHMKWKMARTKKTGQMTSEAAKEIAEKIVSHFQLLIAIIYVYYVID